MYPNKLISRRTMLQASGVAISLPLLETFAKPARAAEAERAVPRRLVAINVGLGLHAPNIVPQQSGESYELSPYLQELQSLRDHFTFISGASHPGVAGGHASSKSFLTAAKHPNSAGFKNSISIDQLAAEQLGTATRFRSLSLSSSGPGLSWSRSGVEIPTDTRPSQVFNRLFIEGKAKQRQAQVQKIQDGRSVLDEVLESAKRMQRRVSNRDREKIDQYFAAVREAEQRLMRSEAWEQRPKPDPGTKPPRDEMDRAKMIERLDLMYDMMALAIESDSTRFLTLYDTGMNAVPAIQGVDTDYHMLSHHGKDPSKIEQLTTVETEIMKSLNRFLTRLHSGTEQGETLLDRTMVLFGSNLGNASSHDTRNMPIVFAGGGFKHGKHLAFDQQNNYELPKLYVTILQRLGLEVDSFAETTGTMTGIDV